MKKNVYLLILFGVLMGCEPEEETQDEVTSEENAPVLVGQDGNPRFNLQFTNPENVDLDLYVRTPNGNVIYYGNLEADNGKLDVDCLCGDCPQGPNENIFWENGTAPSGEYEFWIDYFGDCGSSGASSSYTLRVIRNGQVLETKTGSMDTAGSSLVWSFQQQQ